MIDCLSSKTTLSIASINMLERPAPLLENLLLQTFFGTGEDQEITTLDILSRYIGFKDFKTFCNTLRTQPEYESSFFSAKVIDVTTLTAGQRVEICWNPNRLVTLEYLGDFRFRVISSANSHLMADDEFTATSFMQDYPLYIAAISRNGELTPSYIAGSSSGLTSVTVLK